VWAYLFWEAGVSAVCLAAVVRFRPLAMRLPLFLSLNLIVIGLSAASFSHARQNSPAGYLILAAVFLAVGAALAWTHLRPCMRQLARLLQTSPRALAIWFALGALLALSIRPVEDVDSLYNLHYVVGWVNNLTTPYAFAYNYVPLWDLISVPALVLTRGDSFFWFNSLKPVLLLGITLWLLARELRLPHATAVWTIAAMLTFPYLWLGPSGVSTNKNDMMHAAGLALMALTAARWAKRKTGRADVVVAALATAFISVKASGPVMLLLSGIVVCVFGASRIRRNFRLAISATAVIGLVWFVAAGHYYWHNYLAYGNPVYPYQINAGPIHLPGRADMSATSILYSLGYADTWRYFFLPADGVSPDGVLFPLILAALLLTSMAIAVIALVRRRMSVAAILAVFQLLAWGLYFRSYYTASGSPGDLALLRYGLNSTRYIEGPLLVGVICLLGALIRMGVPRAVIYLLLAAQAGSCFLILLRAAPDQPWAIMAGCGVGLALCSLGLRRRLMLPAVAAVVTLSLFVGIHLVERRRPLWAPTMQTLYRPLYEAQAEDLFYMIDDEFSAQLVWHWPMLGRRLQHGSDFGSQTDLAARAIKPAYVAWVRNAPNEPAPVLVDYDAAVTTPAGILLRRR